MKINSVKIALIAQSILLCIFIVITFKLTDSLQEENKKLIVTADANFYSISDIEDKFEISIGYDVNGIFLLSFQDKDRTIHFNYDNIDGTLNNTRELRNYFYEDKQYRVATNLNKADMPFLLNRNEWYENINKVYTLHDDGSYDIRNYQENEIYSLYADN